MGAASEMHKGDARYEQAASDVRPMGMICSTPDPKKTVGGNV